MSLAERIEAAGVDEQRAMLEEAARFLRPDKFSYMDQTDGWRWEFERKLGTKAYESAAMMLVPEGWRPYTLDMSVKGRSRWLLEGPKTKWETDDDGMPCAGDDWYWFAQGIAATPTLALAAAAIRSQLCKS